MPNLWDKLPEAPPAAELNPLTNPLLERNLRRWANVYFGNPPAKRERAVSNLLEELKRESGNPAESTPSSRMLDAKFLGVVCSACEHPNPTGHKYCSRCGGTLNPAPPAVSESSTAHLATEPQMSRSASPLPGNDAQWIREQRFTSLSEFDTTPRSGWKYVLAAVAIVLAGVAYTQWNSWNKTRVASTTTAPQPQMSAPPAPATNDSSSAEPNRPRETSSQPIPDAEGQKKSAPETAPDRAAVPAGVQPAAQRSPLLTTENEKPHPAASVEESGASDLRLAQRYLGGGAGPRDSSEAAKLLWKAVKKQNATAEVLLSDLYAKGDGVPQSCDQARLLLVAAAKRGSPQAAQQLRDLESRGCR